MPFEQIPCQIALFFLQGKTVLTSKKTCVNCLSNRLFEIDVRRTTMCLAFEALEPPVSALAAASSPSSIRVIVFQSNTMTNLSSTNHIRLRGDFRLASLESLLARCTRSRSLDVRTQTSPDQAFTSTTPSSTTLKATNASSLSSRRMT